jgi:hydrogenase-4 membrane subunit HyfE
VTTVPSLLQQTAVLLAYLMVLVALLISASTTLTHMVRLYQAQAWILVAVVLLTAFGPQEPRYPVAVLAFLPAGLALAIRPLLARASLPAPPRRARAPGPPGWRPWVAAARARLRQAQRDAELAWLQQGASRLRGGRAAGVEIVLIVTAFLVTFRLARSLGGATFPREVTVSLAVSISLLLQGLFTMSNKRDIVAQVIGLLVMEHGLFVVAVRVAPSALASLFVISLFFYVAVTLTILAWILPVLYRASESGDLDKNSHLKG